jgi:ribosome-binding protein aMBF1 (putative translation factor)
METFVLKELIAMATEHISKIEKAALEDPDVKFGYDNYELLKQIGEFVREMRSDASLSQMDLHRASGIPQSEISRLENGAMERGPSLSTLARLAHAAGKRLVIGIEDPEGGANASARVLTL